MSSREQPSRLNFTNTRGRGGRLRPDYGNRFYFHGSRGRGGGFASKPAHNLPPEPNLKEGLDTTKIVGTIPAPARHTAPEDFPIDNVKYVASYNWTEAEKPTMVVPGTAHNLPQFFLLLISVINPLQVRQLYGQGVAYHSLCSPTTAPFTSTRIARSCPSTRCYHSSPLRTRYMVRRRRYPSTGRPWTSSRTAMACASSCAGLTRRQAERYAISGSTSSLSGPRPSY